MADLVILTKTSTAYEIKSEWDTLYRLKRQLEAYPDVGASVKVMTGENHADEVLRVAPQDVGVLMLTKRYQITTLRDGRDSPSRTQPLAIFDTISLRESALVLADMGMTVPDVTSDIRWRTYRDCFLGLDPVQLHASMVRTLKKTRSRAHLKEWLLLIGNYIGGYA